MPRRAFTLVELLVSVAIIAILLSLFLGTVQATKQTARQAVDLSQMRQTCFDFASWANDHRGRIVNAGSPNASTNVSRAYYDSLWGLSSGWSLYLSQQEHWPRILAHWSDGTISEHWRSSYSEPVPDQSVRLGRSNRTLSPAIAGGSDFAASRTDYRLGRTLLTQSSAWMNPGAAASPTPAPLLADDVRYADVRHPSAKGLLWLADWPGARHGRHHVAFVDASVSIRDWKDARPTAVPPFLSSGEPGEPVDATFNGARGRDF